MYNSPIDDFLWELFLIPSVTSGRLDDRRWNSWHANDKSIAQFNSTKLARRWGGENYGGGTSLVLTFPRIHIPLRYLRDSFFSTAFSLYLSKNFSEGDIVWKEILHLCHYFPQSHLSILCIIWKENIVTPSIVRHI